VIERAVVVAEGDAITPPDLPDAIRAPSAMIASKAAAPSPTTQPAAPAGQDMKAQMQRHEAIVIFEALKRADWNQSEAARALRIPLRTLVHKIKTYGIKKLGYGLG
jgi:DNA-binding NtrC family response regulator